jgi:hypothetical protein
MHAHLKIPAAQLTEAMWLFIFTWADSAPDRRGILWSETDKLLVLLSERVTAPAAVVNSLSTSAARSSSATVVTQRWWASPVSALRGMYQIAIESLAALYSCESTVERGAANSPVKAEAGTQQQITSSTQQLSEAIDEADAELSAAAQHASLQQQLIEACDALNASTAAAAASALRVSDLQARSQRLDPSSATAAAEAARLGAAWAVEAARASAVAAAALPVLLEQLVVAEASAAQAGQRSHSEL